MKLLFENWRKLLKETKLRVFDFDDTLVKSDSRIKVTSEDGTEEYLTPAEFAHEGEKPDNTYDYSEFETVVDPRELKKGTDILKSVVGAGTDGREIVILTARAPESETAIKDYLESIGIDISKITFVLLGDADPKMKSSWIEKRILDGANDVVFIDDSGKNVDAVRELEDKYPEVKFDIRKVSYAEEIDEQTEPFQQAVKKGYRKMKMRLISTGPNKYNVGGKMKKPPTTRSKSAPVGFGGSLEESE
jgi:hypothetical protein